jgi:hypothetical protein
MSAVPFQMRKPPRRAQEKRDGPVFVERKRPMLKPGLREMLCSEATLQNRFGREVVCLKFSDPLSGDAVCWYANASASEGSKFFAAWMIANGGLQPTPRQVMSVRVFRGKFFEVEIGETRQTYDGRKLKAGEGYAVVNRIVRRTQ